MSLIILRIVELARIVSVDAYTHEDAFSLSCSESLSIVHACKRVNELLASICIENATKEINKNNKFFIGFCFFAKLGIIPIQSYEFFAKVR